jgi:hypothetical protein
MMRKIIKFLFHSRQFSELKPASFVETALCYVTPKPLDCVKEQAGRMLNYWEAQVDATRQQLMGKCLINP